MNGYEYTYCVLSWIKEQYIIRDSHKVSTWIPDSMIIIILNYLVAYLVVNRKAPATIFLKISLPASCVKIEFSCPRFNAVLRRGCVKSTYTSRAEPLMAANLLTQMDKNHNLIVDRGNTTVLCLLNSVFNQQLTVLLKSNFLTNKNVFIITLHSVHSCNAIIWYIQSSLDSIVNSYEVY